MIVTVIDEPVMFGAANDRVACPALAPVTEKLAVV
jgi:hypothetical protein